MITTNGKNIIAKYLLNQAPEFASHIAIGIGGNALPTSSSVSFLPDSKSLDFEVVRVPVLSKGLIKDFDNEGNPVENIIFKAELPTDQRFQITEIGLFPAESNVLAENYDSKIVLTFDQSEQWTYARLGEVEAVGYEQDIPLSFASSGDIEPGFLQSEKYAFINNDSSIFEFSQRLDRNEPPRYLNRSLLSIGNASIIDPSFDVNSNSASAGYYLENNSINLNLGKNLPTDQIKLAFSVINSDLEAGGGPPNGGVRIRLEFINNIPGSPKAYVNISLSSSELEDKRYQIVTKSLSDFTTTSSSFSWSSVNGIRIYSCAIDDVDPENYYILFDGIKFENISTSNPLYSLVAAEYIKTPDSYPVLKRENSTSYIEYRFGLGVS
jgi:hypothetical protein